ncbi:MAG TPA: hypothetical protein VFQ85_10580 [Mycobacteriales bacterium]|jgi:hypothetical protein|nr:hypothetical protein [Mycobacteriales bacterium]
MRPTRTALVAALAGAAAAVLAPPAAANDPNNCHAAVSIHSTASGEFQASVWATVTGGCDVTATGPIQCRIVLTGPLGVVATATGTGTAAGGCTAETGIANGLQGGLYTATGLVTYNAFVPGVATTAKVA